MTRGEVGTECPERLAQQALHAVALDGPAHLPADGHAETRLVRGLLTRERVQHQVARGMRTPLAVDAIELRTPGKPLPPGAPAAAALPGRGHRYGVSRLRPLSRRRLSKVRPARVRMRARNPWVRARLRFFGW